MTHSPHTPMARLPAIDRLLRLPQTAALIEDHGRAMVVAGLRAAVAGLRAEIAGGAEPALVDEAVLGRARRWLEHASRPSLGPVFNLTGTVLHTNLGRAPLPAEAVTAIAAAAGAANLEFSLDSGRRGERDEHVEAALRRLTGAEAATAVNNNAAAVLLVLNSLALRREVLVSRGELIEIGGSFRLPDIMARAGCRLCEVGTTNRTHLADFEQALGPRTALVLKAHSSNYRIEGFTAAVDDRDLARLARAHGIPFVVDLGSGSLIDLAAFGLPAEPTPSGTLAAGADLVTFSGDKLLGGPQAGIVVGRRDLVERLNRNPLKRALRLDKTALAALAAVLRLYDDPDSLPRRLPALRLLTRPRDEIVALAERLRPAVAAGVDGAASVDVVACDSQIGSGALPVEMLPSAGLRLRPAVRGGAGAGALAAAFRALPIPVIGRVRHGALLFDLRCLEEPERFLAQLPRLGLRRS